MKTSIIFFGSGIYMLPIISMLHEKYDLKLVATTETSDTQPVIHYCTQHTIPFISVKTLRDETIRHKLYAISAPVAILAHFGLIIPQSVIDIFPKGIINIHPSLLPKYRGTTPGQTTILNGDKTTGISIMLIDKEVDHGPLLAQKSYELSPDETAEQFYHQAFILGTKLLERALPDYLTGKLKPTPQDHEKATFTEQLTKESGFIDPAKSIDKQKLQRMIRAYYPWPGVWTKLRIKNQEVRIKLLPDNKIHPEGRKAMTIKDFLNGYPEARQLLAQFVEL